MSWSAPRTWAVSEVLTAANMNTYLSNNLTALGGTIGAIVTTSSSTNNLAYGDIGAAGPAVTLTTMTSAIITLGFNGFPSVAGAGALMTYAISGTTTQGASDGAGFAGTVAAFTSASGNNYYTATLFASSLTAGSNTITAKYRAAGSGTSTFATRHITVTPCTV